MKPICYPCQRFYRPKKNGLYFIEGMPIKDRAPAGKAAPELWEPYKLWSGDLWECPDCHHQLIVGCGYNPVAVQHEPQFKELIERLEATFIVNDC